MLYTKDEDMRVYKERQFLVFGIRMAMTRCENKMLKHIYSEYEEAMKRVSGDIKMNEDIIRKMIKSIEVEKTEE